MKVRTPALAVFSLVFLSVIWTSALAQKTSSAAKADSPARELAGGASPFARESPETYRAATQRLGFDYDVLLKRFNELRAVSASASFRTLIILQQVAQQVNPNQADVTASQVFTYIKAGNSLEKSLGLALSLDKDTVRKYRRAAEKEVRAAL